MCGHSLVRRLQRRAFLNRSAQGAFCCIANERAYSNEVASWGVSLRAGNANIALVCSPSSPAVSAEQARINRSVAADLEYRLAFADPYDLEVAAASLLNDGSRSVPGSQPKPLAVICRALEAGEILALEEQPPVPSLSDIRAALPDGPPSVLPPPRYEPPPPSLRRPEPALPSTDINQDAQAQALLAAAALGTPFCEECEKARQAQAISG